MIVKKVKLLPKHENGATTMGQWDLAGSSLLKVGIPDDRAN